MRRLPFYNGDFSVPLDRSELLGLNKACTRCKLSSLAVRNVCLPAEGAPGGLLVVSDYPSREEDAANRPFVGKAGVYLRSFLSKNWDGPIALDSALRCSPMTDKFGDEEVAACRPYLAQTFAQVAPQRIFAMGGLAIESVLGRSPQVMSVRRGYGWTAEGVPVFLFPGPGISLRNRIIRQRLEEDMQWALTVDLKTLTKPWDFKDFSVVETPEDAESAVTVLSMAEWAAYDTETVGVMYDPSFSVIAVSVATPRGEVFAWGSDALKDPAVIAPLARLLGDSRIKKVGQNVKYDAHAVELGLGVTTKGHVGDTQLWRHLLESDVAADLETQAELVGLGGHKAEAQTHRDAAIKAIRLMRSNRKKLGELAGYTEIFEKAQSTKAGQDLVSTPLLESATLLHETEPEKWAYGMVPEEVLLRYNARDALTTAKLGQLLEARIAADEGAKHVWGDVVIGATEAIQRMESWGMLVDRQALRAYQQHLSDLRLECEKLFSEYPGFNPASTPAVRKLLYTDLKLPVLNSTEKGAASTDASTLQALGVQYPKHKVLQALLEWRKLAKLDGTYAQGLEEHVRADGRIHPTLKIDGAASGRMSCKEPNLQNIPRVDSSTEWGKYPRGLFVAPEGFSYLQLDYSQLELRIAAMLSQDPDMIQIFKDGVDYHQRTAELIAPYAWRIRPEEVTKEHRTHAKTVNFAVLYGEKAKALAAQMNCSEQQAETTMRALFGQFKALRRWMDRALDTTQRTGYARTWWAGKPARSRDLADIAGLEPARKITAENSSVNTPIQGTASDFCLKSVVEVVRWIEAARAPARLVLTVHDSLLLEVEDASIQAVASHVRGIMTGWDSAGVPLAVDMELGKSWGTLGKFTL